MKPITLKPITLKPITLKTNSIIDVYTDGSCINKVGGYGAIFVNGEEIKGKVPSYPTTNQVAELYAIYKTLEILLDKELYSIVTVYTDSKYSIGCLSIWYKNWVKNDWKTAKGQPVKNKELIQKILLVLEKLKDKNVNINFEHVKAHTGHVYNERADRLANEGRMM